MTFFVEPLAQARFTSKLTVAKLSIIHTSCILRCREECANIFVIARSYRIDRKTLPYIYSVFYFQKL